MNDAAIAWSIVVATLALAWVVTYAAGGSRSVAPHGFYIPIIVAAARFGTRSTLATAAAAGVLAGPLMPLDVAEGTDQTVLNWMIRLVIFVLVGLVTNVLVRHSTPSLTGEIGARRLHRDLVAAAEGDQFHLEYQPIVDLRTGRIVGAEALVRWNHPDRGAVRPDDFIPVAERSGFVHVISRWVITDACRQLALWRSGPLADVDSFKLAVNLSGADLANAAVIDHVAGTLERTGIPPHWLHLEVTETALIRDIESAMEGIHALRNLGVRFAIDDFGAGQSSLGQLGRLPVDVLKLDRSFLVQIEQQDLGPVLFGGIIALARAMDVVTVAEGIETLEQALIVRRSGCDLAQGFLFSAPAGPAAFVDTLRRHDRPCSGADAVLDLERWGTSNRLD